MIFALFSHLWIVLPLLVITVFTASLYKSRNLQIVIILVMLFFTILEMISVYFSGVFINYQFYANLNLSDIIEGLLIFKLQAVLVSALFIAMLFFIIKLTSFLQKKIKQTHKYGLILVCLLTLSYPNGPFSKLYEIAEITLAPKTKLTDALLALNMSDYPQKSEIKAEKGKNIIVISLESFEQGFLDNQKLTPHLNQLKQEYQFYKNMPMTLGSSWTTASMFTYMTGMPFLIAGLTNPPLSDAKSTQLVNLGHLLKQANYQTKYIVGNPNFAAIGHIISLFDIDIIDESSYPNQYPKAPFGLYDKDVFDIAKKQVTHFVNDKAPFALFISTISTHAPDGFYDERMESVVDKNQDQMDFVVQSLDYNLHDFITFLKQKKVLDNTVFYIFPDHLMMGLATKTITNLSQNPRQLYLLTNAKESDTAYQLDDVIYQIDMPKIILNGAKIKTNAKFLTDYLLIGTNKAEYIIQHKSQISSLNNAATN